MRTRVADTFAKTQTLFFRFLADKFFASRYGHRAVVLETIAGVPGMVAGMWIHLKSLRQMRTGYGPKIRELLAEAENERMHLMFFIEIAKPNIVERWLILAAQAIFWNYYFVLYVCAPKTAHLMVHYFEEEAVKSYTSYLKLIESGAVENVPAPNLAIEYYGLSCNARLSDLIQCVRADEQHHATVNAEFANTQAEERPKPMQFPTSPRRHKTSELLPRTIAETTTNTL
ncbi:alternative oxidase [Gammaproteobacteria bacterium]|nr:alternative oxidase [Gammaproteobacteria bacterium]